MWGRLLLVDEDGVGSGDDDDDGICVLGCGC